jgi:N-acyl-D-aspartate/D-glutamate deacylase
MDPAVRKELAEKAKGTAFERLADWSNYRIGDTIAPQNHQYEGRLVSDIAKEKGIDPGECLIEITSADEYKTVLWPLPTANSDEDWYARRDLWAKDDVLIGGSDAGAHLDRMLGSPYPTRFLADSLRGRKLISIERTVQLMTEVPAQMFGLRDRGRIAVGGYADIGIFDPETVDSGPAKRVYDLPGDSLRLTSKSIGVTRVFVNGVPTIEKGESTGALSGTVLRSGKNTDTVATH